MAKLLMPRATAVWLIENTTLTFDQISGFTALHGLEIQAIADGEVGAGMKGVDPVQSGQLTKEMIEKCEKDSTLKLSLRRSDLPEPISRHKGPRYTPLSKRADKPDAIAWVLRHHPELSDLQICRLIGTTKPTILAVRDKSHWNSQNLKPRSPAELGLCTQIELATEIEKAIKAGRKPVDDPMREHAKTVAAFVTEEPEWPRSK
ncbi:MAG: cell cycle transcriptional regulator TrcR [Alphaproteobacteria bacterium]